jgi:hypothetical protein
MEAGLMTKAWPVVEGFWWSVEGEIAVDRFAILGVCVFPGFDLMLVFTSRFCLFAQFRFHDRTNSLAIEINGGGLRRLAGGLADERSAAASMCTCTSLGCLSVVLKNQVAEVKVLQAFAKTLFSCLKNFKQI